MDKSLTNRTDDRGGIPSGPKETFLRTCTRTHTLRGVLADLYLLGLLTSKTP